jgi:hypothetical protein
MQFGGYVPTLRTNLLSSSSAQKGNRSEEKCSTILGEWKETGAVSGPTVLAMAEIFSKTLLPIWQAKRRNFPKYLIFNILQVIGSVHDFLKQRHIM